MPNGGTGKTNLANVTVGNATNAETAEKVANALTVTVNGEETEYDGSAAAAVTVSASNPNLIDNSNFAINQRGLSQYNGIQYGVDRWRSTSSKTVLFAHAQSGTIGYPEYSGIKITATGSDVYQYLSNFLKSDTHYTISVCYSRDTSTTNWLQSLQIASYTFNTTGASYSSSSSFSPFEGVTIYVGHGRNKYVRIYRASTTNQYYSIRWIKLEEGDVATPYEIPDPATELLKCQRYYVKYTQDIQLSGSVANAGNEGYADVVSPLPNEDDSYFGKLYGGFSTCFRVCFKRCDEC